MPEEQAAALAEGRRIYVGNLLYTVEPKEIESMLEDHGFDGFEHIHISIDPVSARNPGYCFVDFKEREDAERALEELRPTLRGRPVKIGPCRPKTQAPASRPRYPPSFERWGNFNSQTNDRRRQVDGPRAALDHFDDVLVDSVKRRVWIGGLPKMLDQAQNQEDLQIIFKDFNPTAIGKRITPHESTRNKGGHHHYCFVDFATAQDAAAAVQGLNGKEAPWGVLSVRLSNSIPAKLNDRRRADRPREEGTPDYPRDTSSRAMSSNNWRRGGT